NAIARGPALASSCLLFMNSIESKHNDVPETQPNGEHAVAPQASASPGANRLLAYPPQSSADAESKDGPATKSPSKRIRIAAITVAVILMGWLALGFIPRWRQRQAANADTSQLLIPTVSVVSPLPEKAGDGLRLPAEIRPWLEASIFSRAYGYLKSWIADIVAHY